MNVSAAQAAKKKYETALCSCLKGNFPLYNLFSPVYSFRSPENIEPNEARWQKNYEQLFTRRLKKENRSGMKKKEHERKKQTTISNLYTFYRTMFLTKQGSLYGKVGYIFFIRSNVSYGERTTKISS